MKLKNDSRGFTLIELLITVAIMLSILIISITSITGVDKRKKEEAYKQVVNTIETAAEQFVSSNEYFFTPSSNVTVPLSELIERGYISNVVDPRYGTKINECTYVTLDVSGKKVKVKEFVSVPSETCELKSAKLAEPTSKADITTKFVCGDEKDAVVKYNGWFNQKSLSKCKTLSVKVDITKNKGDNVELHIVDNNVDSKVDDLNCESNVETCSYIDEKSFNSDTTSKKVVYKLVTKKDEITVSKKARIDTAAPTVPEVGLYKFKDNSVKPTSENNLEPYAANTWSEKKIFTKATSTDATSGIAGYKYVTTGTTTNTKGARGRWRTINTNGESTIKYMACDNAENCSTYSDVQTVKIDTVAPTVTVSLTSDDGKSIKSIKSGSHAHYKNMKYKITASDKEKNNSKSDIKEIRYIVENGLKTNKKFKDYKNTILSGTENLLLDFAGKKTVYAVAIDNAGNRGYAYAVGILDNDAVAVNHEKQQCNFTLTFSLRYAHTDKQIADGFQYAVWNVESTSDETNEQSGGVANRCGSAPPDNATLNKVSGNESEQIRILTKKRSKAYYCFAVRPLKVNSKYVPKYDDLKWTVQRKHAMSDSCQ